VIPPQSGVVNSAVSLQVTATGTPTITYSDAVTGFLLPPGLVISSSGLITGNLPATPAVYNVRLRATNGAGSTDSATFTWTVTAAPAPPIFNAPASVTYPESTGTLNLGLATYNTGGVATSWAILGGAPPGSTIAANGVLTSNITTREGTWAIIVRATNADGSSTDTFNLIVTSSNPTVPIAPSSTLNTVGDTVSVPMTTYLAGATSYSATGLPAGLTINTSTGLVSGVPTTASLNNPIITGTNIHGSTPITFQWTIQNPPVAGAKRYGRVTPYTRRV
jgi:hypothetical protein